MSRKHCNNSEFFERRTGRQHGKYWKSLRNGLKLRSKDNIRNNKFLMARDYSLSDNLITLILFYAFLFFIILGKLYWECGIMTGSRHPYLGNSLTSSKY